MKPLNKDAIQEKMILQYSDSKFNAFLDFMPIVYPNFLNIIRWRESIRTKMRIISLLSKDIFQQYQLTVDQKEKDKLEGYGDGIAASLLLIRFENYLNAVYSLLNNLAYIGQISHKGLAHQFNTQRERASNYRKKYPRYSEYLDLIENCQWYDQLHAMRTDATHFLEGFVYYTDDGLGILYFDKEPKEFNNDVKLKIEDIRIYTEQNIKDLSDFLDCFGEYYLTKYCNNESSIPLACPILVVNGKSFFSGFRSVTYEEYQNKNIGRCMSKDPTCKFKDFCPARQAK
ncbi:MAG: hypothetical protein WC586_04065 [Methanoregula sp.]